MTREIFVAVFDSRAAAEAAERDLEASGIPAGDIDIRAGDTTETRVAGSGAGTGFWDWLLGTGPEDDRLYYQEHLRGGGRAVLSVAAEDGDYQRIAAILEHHAPLQFEPRGTAGTGAATTTAGAARAGATRAKQEEAVLPTAKEELEVGKRAVEDTHSYRVRRYVVEHPVEKTVGLRDERVTVERREAGHGAVGERPFEEKVVEVTERREEPVVRKVVKPGEEVVVRKEAADRTETVRDTVRESKVEVDKAAAGDKPSTKP